MEEEIIRFDLETIEKEVYTALISLGYVPGEAEIQDIAEIFIAVMVKMGIVDEVTFIEEDEEDE